MYFNDTNFFAFSCQVIDNFFSCFTHRTHSDDNTISIWSTIVVEQLVFTTCHLADFSHVFFYDFWKCIVELVACFTTLEVNIWVLSCTSHNWMFWVQSGFSELCQCIVIY